MIHVDDWLDDYMPNTDGARFAKLWLEHFRRPAGDTNYKALGSLPLFCAYKDGKRYRCIGASRMGDVWLTADFTKESGYDLRIDVTDCDDWSGSADTTRDRK